MKTYVIFPLLVASLASLTFSSEMLSTKNEALSFKQKYDTKFGKLNSTLTNCILSYLTVTDGEGSLALVNTTCNSFCQEIRDKNLRFFKGKAFDIPEISNFSVTVPEVQRILSLNQVEDPFYVQCSLYFDLKTGRIFNELSLPVMKYLIRIFSDNSNLQNLRIKEFAKSEKVLDNLVTDALELGHVDMNLSIDKLFKLKSKDRTRILKRICTNPQLFEQFKDKIKLTYANHYVEFMAHMIINGVPLIEFFFDKSRNENKAKAGMYKFANSANIQNIIFTVFSVNDTPKSEYSRIHALISHMIEVYFAGRDRQRRTSIIFNDIRFGSTDDFNPEIKKLTESFSFDAAFFAFLGGKMDLFRHLVVNSESFIESIDHIESFLKSSRNEDGAFSFLANVLEICPHEDIKNLIWESDSFTFRVVETYYCIDYRILPDEANAFEFEMAAEPELKILGSPNRILLRYNASERGQVIENSIRFKDPFVFERFIDDVLVRSLQSGFCYQINRDNLKLVIEHYFLIEKFNETGIHLHLNSSIIEFVLEHPENRKLIPILERHVPLSAIFLLKTDLQFATLEYLLNIRIDRIVRLSLNLHRCSSGTYFKLRNFILYCLKQPNRDELLKEWMPSMFWEDFKLEFTIEYAELQKF